MVKAAESYCVMPRWGTVWSISGFWLWFVELIVAGGALLLSFSTLGLFLISNALPRFTLQLSFILTPDFFFSFLLIYLLFKG